MNENAPGDQEPENRDEILVEGTLVRVVHSKRMKAYGIMVEHERIHQPYIVTEESGQWWILFLHPYFRQICVFEGPPFEDAAEVVHLLRDSMTEEQFEYPPGFTLLHRFRDPDDLDLLVDHDNGTFVLRRNKAPSEQRSRKSAGDDDTVDLDGDSRSE